MENLSGNGGCCLGFRPSSSLVSETSLATTHSIRSSKYSYSFSRTESECSTFSEIVDDSICSDLASPHTCWGPRSDVLHPTEENKKIYAHQDHEDPESVLEIMEERFSKLLLGEDMSGSGKGVCSAITISNAITNLYATLFSQNLKLQPLSPKNKNKWKVEMDCLLSICDYILEFFPQTQKLADGTLIEVMSSRRRSDIYMNLPALKKLDDMLIEILEEFKESEFWYVEKEKTTSCSWNRIGSFRMEGERKKEKWWVPMPCVPQGGLSEKCKNNLKQKRESAKQIHKAAMAINTNTLSEMTIPHTYLSSIPKCGKTSVGDYMYKHLSTINKFSPEQLLTQLDIKSEHEALVIADRVEASMYIWRRKACTNEQKTSWAAVKSTANGESRGKNQVLAERAERVLCSLKHKYPHLSQTTLDMCKIQYNRDVGQAILESYSRVLESMAFNIVGWIEDLINEDIKR